MAEQDPKPPIRRWRPGPRIDAYFVSALGEKYHVYDTVFRQGRNYVLPLGSPKAECRIFVPERSEMKRSYRFQESDSRILDPVRLNQQLLNASYVGRRVDNSERTPW
jgi:hypothetical protein